MINDKLLNPSSIVIVGGSDDISKPGGKIIKNILDGNFRGDLVVVNPKSDSVQGLKSYRNAEDLPGADLAILAVAAKYCGETVDILARKKGVKAFIIISAGFSEENEEGAKHEKEIASTIEDTGGCLIGPNCIGVLCQSYNGVFTSPIPVLDPKGVDFISGSGATAVFIMESAIPNGITFSSVFSVGNSAQTGVEDVLAYLDDTYVAGESSAVKLLYIESINKPDMLLRHATSLAGKGCRIAAIKAGTSEAGSRAASSHTGAMASPDAAVDALFRKAGIIRCYSRGELAAVAAVLLHPQPAGRNIAIITHAGGPAVMLTDALAKGGVDVPALSGPGVDNLLTRLHPGSSATNPIDILATGYVEQLEASIDACENDFDEIDAMVVIFGSPGLFTMDEVYNTLDARMRTCRKPIYAILPSMLTAGREVKDFLSKGRMNFPDEVAFANAFTKVINMDHPGSERLVSTIDRKKVRNIIDSSGNGYLEPEKVQQLLEVAGIQGVKEFIITEESEIEDTLTTTGLPVAMKVVGPVHKSDVGGVSLDVKDSTSARDEFKRMMKIKDTTGILIQPMLSGVELFVGAKREEGFGHLVMAGLGGIFIEILKDVTKCLNPVSQSEAETMISSLKARKMLEGVRGQAGVDIESFRDVIVSVSELVTAAPEIFEMDINPLIGTPEGVTAVDARIRIEK